MIDVDNVTIRFNLASQKVDNLKEYVIKMLKKELMFQEFFALRDVSFKVHAGEAWGVIGTNGSGKSTLLKTISGILRPYKGTIRVGGSIAPLIELGAGFDGNMTARENIFLNGCVLGHTEKYMREHFDEIVEFAELWNFLDSPIKNYSSGMKARLGFSVATMVRPEILIVDEILAVGDYKFRKKCAERMEEMLGDGTTLLYVSHSIEEVRSLCTHVLWLEKGNVVKAGPTEEICDEYLESQQKPGEAKEERHRIRKIAVYGTERLGLVWAVCLAERGNRVAYFEDFREEEKDRINLMKAGRAPFTEYRVNELMRKNQERLSYTTEFEEAVRDAEVIIYYPDPGEDKEAAEARLMEFGRRIAETVRGECTLVLRNQNPVGTADRLDAFLKEHRDPSSGEIHIAVDPSFLKPLTAVHDALHPARIILGVQEEETGKRLSGLYRGMDTVPTVTDLKSAEMMKIARSEYEVLRARYAEELAENCREQGADPEEVFENLGFPTDELKEE